MALFNRKKKEPLTEGNANNYEIGNKNNFIKSKRLHWFKCNLLLLYSKWIKYINW